MGYALSTVLSIAVAFGAGSLVSAMAEKGAGDDAVPVLLGCLALSVVGGAAVIVLQTWVPVKVQIERLGRAASRALRDVLGMAQAEYEKSDKGYYLNVLSGSTDVYGKSYADANVLLVGSTICLIAVLIGAGALDALFVPVFLAYFALFGCAMMLPANRLAAIQRDGLPAQDAFMGEAKSIVESKRSINTTHSEVFFGARYRKRGEGYERFCLRRQFWQQLANSLPTLLTNLLQVGVLGVSAWRCLEGAAPAGSVFTAYIVASLAQEPLSAFLLALTSYASNVPHVERLRSLASRAAEPSGFGALRGGEAGPVVARLDGALYADASRSGEPLFRARGIEVRAGSLVVVKGPNGSGKSRLLDFLAGLSDPACLDGRAELSPELASCDYLTYPVPVVAGTLADNMLGARPDPAAARALGLGDLASREITDQPLNLSLGERQKIGLLRALSGGSPVLLLDEPLTNLDGAAREGLCRLVEGMRGERTVVAVMHSGELDGAADQILEVRGGELERVK
ncbi:ATP-binding cassette domain-containing protein [Olsenella profusa]|uniref:ABC transporter ATP-binding protein n=1 Tax=Olsenella profusa TaxID=138595 RepID=A0ABS2F3G1_9ACTN|nr:ABC transporter ATP-binding protein [Olsenella profusa]